MEKDPKQRRLWCHAGQRVPPALVTSGVLPLALQLGLGICGSGLPHTHEVPIQSRTMCAPGKEGMVLTWPWFHAASKTGLISSHISAQASL